MDHTRIGRSGTRPTLRELVGLEGHKLKLMGRLFAADIEPLVSDAAMVRRLSLFQQTPVSDDRRVAGDLKADENLERPIARYFPMAAVGKRTTPAGRNRHECR